MNIRKLKLIGVVVLGFAWILSMWFVLPQSPRQKVSELAAQNVPDKDTGDRELAARMAKIEKRLAVNASTLARLNERLHEVEIHHATGVAVGRVRQTSVSKVMDQGAVQNANKKNMEHGGLSAALLRAGIAPDVRDRIMRVVGRNRMAILSLRDKAAREGKLGTREYISELDSLADTSKSLRSSFGDDVYDRYLFAVGKPNRVLVTDVYPDSPAEDVGIQGGDLVLRYASKNIFSINDLKSATVAGIKDEPVLVEWQHDGVNMNATVPRGPLGVNTQEVIQRPK